VTHHEHVDLSGSIESQVLFQRAPLPFSRRSNVTPYPDVILSALRGERTATPALKRATRSVDRSADLFDHLISCGAGINCGTPSPAFSASRLMTGASSVGVDTGRSARGRTLHMGPADQADGRPALNRWSPAHSSTDASSAQVGREGVCQTMPIDGPMLFGTSGGVWSGVHACREAIFAIGYAGAPPVPAEQGPRSEGPR